MSTSPPTSYIEQFERGHYGEPLRQDPKFFEQNSLVCASLFRGDVEAFNNARRDHPDWIPLMYRWNFTGTEQQKLDLRGVDFRNVDLRGSKFSNVNLSGVSFEGSLMGSTEFELCDLRDTNFSGMDFQYGEFHWCDLRHSNFSGIEASTASFYDSNLTGANFRDADLRFIMRFWNLNLTDSDLRGAKLRPDSFRNNKMDGIQIDPGQTFALLSAQLHNLQAEIRRISRRVDKALADLKVP